MIGGWPTTSVTYVHDAVHFRMARVVNSPRTVQKKAVVSRSHSEDLLYVCTYVPEWIYTHHMLADIHRGQKRASDALVLK